jgi:hypothetical protein
VEPGLEQAVVERVCADIQSPIAPTLQIFVTRLWISATAKNESSPVFDRALLSSIEERSDYLIDFLDRQLEDVARQFPTDDNAGLLLDLLAFHVSEAMTSAERTRDAIYRAYQHLGADVRLFSRLVPPC